MKIYIYTPLSISEKGGRLNNEDSIYPSKGKATDLDKIFLVCDGVGGARKGATASRLICTFFPEFLENIADSSSWYDKKTILDGTKYTEEKIKEFLNLNPNCIGMASTFTLLCFHDKGCTVAWAGDSRIYQIREGAIIFRSKDHSLVNLMIENHKITEEEAKSHPQKNVILKAINGIDSVIPGIEYLSDIKKNDFFMLCSDGILENFDDQDFIELFSNNNSSEEILKIINHNSSRNAKDNYSLYLIKVKNINYENSFDIRRDLGVETIQISKEQYKKEKKTFFWKPEIQTLLNMAIIFHFIGNFSNYT